MEAVIADLLLKIRLTCPSLVLVLFSVIDLKQICRLENHSKVRTYNLHTCSRPVPQKLIKSLDQYDNEQPGISVSNGSLPILWIQV